MATDAGTIQDSFQDLLYCMICFETYRSPKMLACCHTFCEQCLEGYLKTYQQQKRTQAGKIPCPTCRELTKLPPGGVSNLRTDFKVAKIEDMFRTMMVVKRKNGASSGQCSVCKSKTKSVSTSAFCSQCDMTFCKDCKKKHDKNPLFKSHIFVSKNGKGDGQILRCKVHQQEEGKFYCCTCDTVTCTACVVSNHNEHNITETSVMFSQHKEDIANLKPLLESKVTQIKKKVSELELLRTLNLNSSQQSEIAIKERTRELLDHIKREEVTLLDELKRKRDEKIQFLDNEISQMKAVTSQADNLQKYATRTSSQSSLHLLAIHENIIQRMRTVLGTDVQSINVSTATEANSVVTFLPGKHDPVVGRIDVVQGTLDKLSKSTIAGNPKSIRLSATVADRARSGLAVNGIRGQETTPDIPSSKAIRQNLKILVKVNSYGTEKGQLKDPITVACLLNGDIVVGEWGNQRIQVFDNVGHFKDFIGSGRIGPQGISITLRGNIVVTDANQKRVQVFSPHGSVIATWGLGRFFAPCGVAVSANGHIVITDVGEHSVSIYQGERKCLNRIGTKGKSDNNFQNPLYVTTGINNEIIVSDSDNHCIKIFDANGQFLLKFGSEGSGDGQLSFPRGVTTDLEGNIIIADRNNDRVSLFSFGGHFLRHLLKREDGIREPYAVALTITGNLIVTESANGRAALKVFQLE